MTKPKKITAVAVAAAITLTTFVPAFAAYTPVNGAKAVVLNKLDLYKGTKEGEFVPALEAKLTRGQGAVLLARLFDMEDAANALTDAQVAEIFAGFEDAAKVPNYAKKIMAYLIKNEVMLGVKDTKTGKVYVNADEDLLGGQFSTLMLREMGYTVDSWKDAIAQLSEVEGAKDIAGYKSYADKSVLRDQAVGIIYGALTADYSNGLASIIEKIVEKNPNLKAIAEQAGLIEVAQDLAVENLTSTNLREVFVSFNKAIDKDVAETEANYVLNVKSGAAALATAELQSDNKTVKLTLNGSTQQANIDITFKNIKDADGKVMSDVTKNIVLFDTAIPAAVSYVFTGPTTIEITYSEPINSATSALSALVDNGIYGASAVVKAGTENVVEITLGTVLPEGNHTLKISGAKDFAGYAQLDKNFEITYVKDVTAPVVSIDTATQTKVVLKFNKAIKGDALTTSRFYHTYTAYAPDSVADVDGNAIDASKYYDKVVVNFTSKPLPSGSTNVVVLKTVGDITITDRYGNVMAADTTLTASISADTTAPVVSKVEATAENTVVVTFSEDVANANVKANYVFKKADGTVIAADKYNTPVYDSSKFTATITFTPALTGGAYSVEVSNVKDTSLNANALVAVAKAFTVTDKTAITTASAIFVEKTGTAADEIYVTFPENMATSGSNSVLDLSNYRIGTTAANAVSLADGSVATVFGTNDKVKITIPGTGAADLVGKKLYVRNLADASGNVMKDLYLEITLAADTAPVITEVKSIALNKFELKIDRQLSSINAADILVNGSAVAQATYVNNTDGTATITVVVPDANKLANSGVLPSAMTWAIGNGGYIKSITGTAMAQAANALTGATVVDGVAATVSQVKFISSTKIEITFTEELDAATFAAAGKNGFSVSGGTLTSALLKSGDAKVVVLTGTDFTADTDVTYTPGNITDAATVGNVIAAFTHTDALAQ